MARDSADMRYHEDMKRGYYVLMRRHDICPRISTRYLYYYDIVLYTYIQYRTFVARSTPM